jgi:hypothetical protein
MPNMSISDLQSSAAQRRSTWCGLSKAFALVSLLLLNSAIYAAGICPVSKPVGLFGIGDGCTLGYNNIPIAPPNFFVFESTFTPSCDSHDACYTSLGGTYGLCGLYAVSCGPRRPNATVAVALNG